jgi:Trk-type K+ transport system membrane component
MTSTGFASTDFALWPAAATMALVGLMFIGGSAGSTSGSVKVVRHLLTGKTVRREFDYTVHPELISVVRLNRPPSTNGRSDRSRRSFCSTSASSCRDVAARHRRFCQRT